MASTEQKMSRMQLTAMVVGGMVGAGIFSLPRTFANATGPLGAVIAWLIAGTGMYMLARVFQSLAERKPDLDAGVFAYAKAGFGDYPGFLSAFGYWIGSCIGNVSYWVLIKSHVPATSAAQRVGNWPRTTTLLAIAALVSLSACRRAEEAPAPEVRPVRVMTIERRSVGDTVSLTGRVQAQSEVNQSFRIDGRLIERNVDIGDRVKPGQLLARLDQMNEDSSLQSARAQLAAAQAQGIEARNTFNRMRDLLAENAVSRASFEQAEALLKVTQSQVESAQSLVNIAQNRVSYTRLLSDVAGVVTARGAEPGEVVPAGRMIVQVAREGAIDAVFDVPAQVKDIAPSNPDILVALGGDPKVTAAGKVREVSPRADPVTGTFAVRVRLINPPAAMRLGSTVTGRMKLDTEPALDIPASALVRANGQSSVWIVDTKAGTVAARNVQVRAYDAARVQVSQGLAPGDVIVTAGVQALRPGQKVRWLEAAK